MSISVRTTRMPAILNQVEPSSADLAYNREIFRNLVFQELLVAFKSASARGGLTRSGLARRLNKKPEQITRWLSTPGNLELDTLSDLLSALDVNPASILRHRASPEASDQIKSLLSDLGVAPKSGFQPQATTSNTELLPGSALGSSLSEYWERSRAVGHTDVMPELVSPPYEMNAIRSGISGARSAAPHNKTQITSDYFRTSAVDDVAANVMKSTRSRGARETHFR